MNVLLFSINEKPYAANTLDIIKIIPNINILPDVVYPPYVAGSILYHGSRVPIIDLGLLLDDRPCKPYFSTRIILVKTFYFKKEVVLGLLAEQVTNISTLESAQSLLSESNELELIDIEKLKSKISFKRIINRKAVT